MSAERIGERLNMGRGYCNLKPVLAGIARAADPERLRVLVRSPQEAPRFHKEQAVDTGNNAAQCVDCFRPLKREQSAIFKVIESNLVRKVFAQETNVIPLHRAVHDQIQSRRHRGDHQIIEDAAIFGKKQRIAHPPFCQRGNFTWYERFERLCGTVPRQDELPHVRHIEQPRILAHPDVFGHDPFILDWHVVVCKGNHPRAFGPVPSVERQHQGLNGFHFFRIVCVAH